MTSRTGSLAVRAVIHLARLPAGEYAGAAGLAEEIDAPQNYLGKLLQTLSRTGLLASRKGAGGGFRLARDPGEITLRDILEPVEHLDRWEGCFLGQPTCSPENACAVHARWAALRDEYLGLLRDTTIADLASFPTQDPPVTINRRPSA